MSNTFIDLPKYIKMFKQYVGRRIYYVFGLTFFSGLADGVGIMMILPVLQALGNQPQTRSIGESDKISSILFYFLSFFNLQYSDEAILLTVIFIFLIKGALLFFALGFTAYLRAKLQKDIRSKLFNLYCSMSYSYYNTRDTGYFVNLINEQVNRAGGSFHAISHLVAHIINGIIYIVFAFFVAWRFGIIAIVVAIILILFFKWLNTFVRNLSRNAAIENSHLSKLLIQALQSLKYLVTTSQTDRFKSSISSSIGKLTKFDKQSGIAISFTQAIREPIAVLFIILIVFTQVIALGEQLNPILVSIVLFYRGLNSMLNTQGYWQNTMEYIGSMELIHKEFITQKTNQEPGGGKLIMDFDKGVEFKNVYFSYLPEQQQVLKDISFFIPSRTSIALIGKSGAGKSTIVDLISLVLKPDKGFILIDGIYASQIKLKPWRKQIGYVSQEAVIFNDTIANNICMWSGNPKSDPKLFRQIKQAAVLANIDAFIESLPNGYFENVGDRGMLLSGGQRQRLFIARELFRKPKLLILDEATSALDSESENEIRKSIDKLKGNITVIIIAHRLSTIRNVDKIYIFDNGELIESGTYNDLKTNKSTKFSQFLNFQAT